MKKYGVILMVVVLSLVLVGCSAGNEKKLVCTQTASGVDIEFNVGFVGNSIKTIDFNYDMDLSSYNSSQLKLFEKQDFCKIVKEAMTEYKSAFKSCKQSIKNKHLKVYSVLDVHKLSNDISKKMTTPEKGKKALEKTGYKCKIK